MWFLGCNFFWKFIKSNFKKKQNKKDLVKKTLDKSNSQPSSIEEKKVESQVSKFSPYSFSFRQGMNFVGKFVRGAQQLYSEINPATLTGTYYESLIFFYAKTLTPGIKWTEN